MKSQAGAVRHALSKALAAFEEPDMQEKMRQGVVYRNKLLRQFYIFTVGLVDSCAHNKAQIKFIHYSNLASGVFVSKLSYVI